MPRFGYLFLFFAITAGGLEVDITNDEVKGLASNNSYVANGQPASLTTENNSHMPVNAGTISKSKQNVSKKMYKLRKQMKTTPATRASGVNRAPPVKKENKNKHKKERDTKRQNTGKSQRKLNTTGLMKENIDQHIFTQSNNDFTDENKFKEFNNNLTDENKFNNSNNDSIDEIKLNRSTTKPTETSSKSSGTKLYPDVQEISTQTVSQTTYGNDNNELVEPPSYDTTYNATSLDTTSGMAAKDNKHNHEVVTLINTQRTFQNDSRDLTESSDDIKTTSTSDTTLKSAPNETLHNNIESNLTSSQQISQNDSDDITITETPDKNSKTTVSHSETTMSYLKPSIESSPKETEPKTDEVTVTIYQQTYEIGNDDPAERLDKNKYKLTTPESLTINSFKKHAKSALKDFKTKNGAVTRPLNKQQTNDDNNLEESSYKENKSAGLFPLTDNVYDTLRLDFEDHFLHFSPNYTEYPNDESSGELFLFDLC
ncbi:putative uncharacterized protein DDB_G0282133 [Physella acuta]|uniref:putative uncharacterized protein DDB_G0282133 n=1 Tax=Physella acuta TaxID=109671 RepID=UPI0027DC1388|nr:putative uncharacterized protein DDB_G0282133 [Physella acuta]